MNNDAARELTGTLQPEIKIDATDAYKKLGADLLALWPQVRDLPSLFPDSDGNIYAAYNRGQLHQAGSTLLSAVLVFLSRSIGEYPDLFAKKEVQS